MTFDFTCPACSSHVQVDLPPIDFHDLTPRAWCCRSHLRPIEMDRAVKSGPVYVKRPRAPQS